jgi:predicted SAM-dependent methyltransferase
MSGEVMKLHVGCGKHKIPGWVNIDAVKDCQPDLVHDLARPLPYADLSADELKAEGVLEHFDKYMRYCIMADWARVLKVGGIGI